MSQIIGNKAVILYKNENWKWSKSVGLGGDSTPPGLILIETSVNEWTVK